MAAATDAYLPQAEDARNACAALWRDLGLLAAPWDDPRWQSWRPGQKLASAPLSLAESGLPIGRLREQGGWDELLLPAALPLIGHGSLLLKTNGAAGRQAVSAVQSLLLRLLAAIPPAKVRFTFIDPIGLGQNVAPFMHLADYDESLVTARAWTETLDRRSQREFEMRVAFQMSGEDSASLIDTPAAGKLGPHRAIFVSEEEARSEKFRPYHLPAAEWLEWTEECLTNRGGE